MRLIQTNDSEPFHNNIDALFSQNILAVVAPLSYVIPGLQHYRYNARAGLLEPVHDQCVPPETKNG